jgi:hypothetical protein
MKFRARIWLAPLALLFAAGCGGSGGSNPSTNADFTGRWKVVLGENQSAVFQSSDTNDTEIALSLTQSGTFLSTEPNQDIWAGNTACNVPAGWWFLDGGWENGILSLDAGSGQVSGQTVNLTLTESRGATFAGTGQLKLNGTLKADGSISGTVTDSCIPTSGNPTPGVSWTATKISIFPPTSWP